MAESSFSESDLHDPIRDYLVIQGYVVQGEVKNCDMVARKGDDLVVVELKKRLSIELLVQACDRQRITDSVYVAIPAPVSNAARASWQGRMTLLRKLELGLITVNFRAAPPTVSVEFHPLPFRQHRVSRRRRAVLREVVGRSGEHNKGGSVRRRIVTAFRERSIHVACCLARFGPMSPKQVRSLDTGPKTLSVLRSQFNRDWFERIDRGVYALKASGSDALSQYPELVRQFNLQLDAHAPPDPGPTRVL